MSLLVRRTARTRVCARDAFLWKKKKKSSFGLSNDLTPASPSGSIHVPEKGPPENVSSGKALGKRPAFQRDPLPHTDAALAPATLASERRRGGISQPWDRRTGRWSASDFGGGSALGSQMGLEEDRPESYGLNDRPVQSRRVSSREFSGLRDNGPPYQRDNNADEARFETRRDEMEERDTTERSRPARTQLTDGKRLATIRDATEGFRSAWTQPLHRAARLHPLTPSRILARAGVPIITKANPSTAVTTESYSPAMAEKNTLPTKFTSPPLLPGLLSGLVDALSLKWVLDPWTKAQTAMETVSETQITQSDMDTQTESYKEFLLASETGSGKSIAEARRVAEGATPIASKRGLNPRALILAPTHELARQLSLFAKALLHDVKLRVLCASRAKQPYPPPRTRDSASRMKALVSYADDGALGEFQVTRQTLARLRFLLISLSGRPLKLMEMKAVEFGGERPGEGPKRRRGRDSLPGSGVGKWRSSPEMGSDFQESTRMLLADISTARGREVPVLPLPVGLPRPALTAEPAAASPQKEQEKKVEENAKTQGKIVVKQHGQSAITPLNYPFNFLVASATIPNWLSAYLNAYHPALQRLVSPNIHFLPKSLKTEYVSWTGGNKYADIERRLRKVWAEDAASGLGP
ncbi:hypothetical protein B0H13DRAFT_2127118, partial [Mycena leptocephala]